MERQCSRSEERSTDNAATRRQPKNRSLCPHPMGRRTNDSTSGSAPGRSQRVSPWTTGDAAKEHRNLSERVHRQRREPREILGTSLRLRKPVCPPNNPHSNLLPICFRSRERFSRRLLRLGGDQALGRSNRRPHWP